MRTLFLLIAAICFGINADAQGTQEYKPLLVDGREWKIVWQSIDSESNKIRYTITVCGDTIVGKRKCKKLHHLRKYDDYVWDYDFAAFEEDRKLYVCDDNGGASKILDFSIHLGDHISNKNLEVVGEDSIEVNGNTYRRLTFNDNNGYERENVHWVEGIGSSYDFWFYQDKGPSPIWEYQYSYLEECYDNGKLVFSHADFMKEPIANGITQGTQKHKPLLVDGREWKIVAPSEKDWLFDDLHFTQTVCGDTIVADRTCKKIHFVWDNPQKEIPLQEDYYYAAFEEDGKLYECDDNGGASKILDFSIHLGDHISNKNLEVVGEDIIEVNGETYRRLTFNDNNGYEKENVRWVEGIGSNYDFWYYKPTGSYPIIMANFPYSYLSECYDNGKLVFSHADFMKEPIANGIAQVTAKKKNGTMYNLLGQRIKAPRKGEIYMQDGKKRMMR